MFAHSASESAVPVALLQTSTCNLHERVPKPKPTTDKPQESKAAAK
jgi:hypothetical protein